jgi:hypothetical protein
MNSDSAVEINNVVLIKGEPGGAKAQQRTISMLFRVLGPRLVIFRGVRCSSSTGDCRPVLSKVEGPLQAAGALHSLWRACRLIAVSL